MPKPSSGDHVSSLKQLGLEAFETVEISRSELKEAPYNPRKISEAQKAKLKTAIQKQGLVAPITWNRRTGRIVGGHQRIGALDSLAGTKNYTLTVAAIDVDETREKELNILLNNDAAQGDWDLEKLFPLVTQDGIDLAGAGFNDTDLFHFFGEASRENLGADALSELAEKVRQFRDQYEEIIAKQKDKNSAEFYLVVVFKDSAQLDSFVASSGWPDNRYQSADDLFRALRPEYLPAGSQPGSSGE